MLTELWTEKWLGCCRCHGHSARSNQDGGSFLRVSKCPELTFFFVAFVRDAIAASSFAGAVITRETMSRWGTARTSSTVAALLDVQRGLCKLIGELTVYTAGVPVVGITECCRRQDCGLCSLEVWLHLLLVFTSCKPVSTLSVKALRPRRVVHCGLCSLEVWRCTHTPAWNRLSVD